MEQLLIIQHNIIHWEFKRRNELYNIYMTFDPDIILLNSTGVTDCNKMKIFNYNVYQRNTLSERHSGIAIAIRKNIPHKLLDNFQEDFLAIQVDTNRGPIVVSTAYLPPRRPYLPYQDFMKVIRKNIPVYFIGDLNAKHRFIGHNVNNNVGLALNNLINQGLISHLGPDFNTFIGERGTGKPDIMITNQHAYLNYSINQGPITSSDHLPLIIKLATKPIRIEIKESYNFKKADWNKFKNKAIEKKQKQNEYRNQDEIKDKLIID